MTIKNVRLLARGMQAEVQLGVDKWGAATWVTVEMPRALCEKELAALDVLFVECAMSHVSDHVVEAKVQQGIAARVEKAIKAAKDRIERNASEKAIALGMTIERITRDLNRAREEVNAARAQYDQARAQRDDAEGRAQIALATQRAAEERLRQAQQPTDQPG